MSGLSGLRAWLRSKPAWLRLQECNKEGWRAALFRSRMQHKILDSPPIRTAAEGPTEVRVLTWRRDYLNALWALKSFYHVAGVDLPLTIHDGGLLPGQERILLQHFPDATFVPKAEADRRITEFLSERGLTRCLEHRRTMPMLLKLFDYFAFSTARDIISIDSDIVFFRRPDELIDEPGEDAPNLFNQDAADGYYCMSPEAMREAFGVVPVPRINAGLSRVRRESIDFEQMERWLEPPEMAGSAWLIEQTLHALSATVYGVKLLPSSYFLSTERGLPGDLVCKHYPGFFRPYLYQEGMAHLVRTGFLDQLRSQPALVPAGR